MAHGSVPISILVALGQTQLRLRDQGYGASASRGVSVYPPAIGLVPNYTAW